MGRSSQVASNYACFTVTIFSGHHSGKTTLDSQSLDSWDCALFMFHAPSVQLHDWSVASDWYTCCWTQFYWWCKRSWGWGRQYSICDLQSFSCNWQTGKVASTFSGSLDGIQSLPRGKGKLSERFWLWSATLHHYHSSTAFIHFTY